MLKEIAEQPKAVADSLRGRIGADHRIQMNETQIDEAVLREVNKVIVDRMRHRRARRHGGEVRDRALDPPACRGRAGQ